MTVSMRNRLKRSALSFTGAVLFCGGFLLSGSEFVGFPWGPLAGACCWVILGLFVLIMRGRYDGRM